PGPHTATAAPGAGYRGEAIDRRVADVPDAGRGVARARSRGAVGGPRARLSARAASAGGARALSAGRCAALAARRGGARDRGAARPRREPAGPSLVELDPGQDGRAGALRDRRLAVDARFTRVGSRDADLARARRRDPAPGRAER